MEHSELKAIALSNPEVKAIYDSLETDFSMLRKMLNMRKTNMMGLESDITPTVTNSMFIDQLTQAALSLPNEARLQLVEELLISLETIVDPSIQSEWLAKAHNRRESIRNGSVQTIPGDEALDQGRQLLN